MIDINIEIGKRIKCLRLEKKLSREQIARRLGVKQQTIEKYEKGSIEISIKKLIQISNIMNVSIMYFLKQEGLDDTLFKHFVSLQVKTHLKD